MLTMRFTGVLLSTVLIGLAGIVVAPASASADTLSGTIIGDLNGDGIPDQITLGQNGTTTSCTVTVANGIAGGGFGTPKTHTYTTLETAQPYCPNLGVVMKLGSQKTASLVTGFTYGDQDLMVVRSFQAVSIMTGAFQPDSMRTGDLTGDGRPDLIEGSEQSGYLTTYTNTAQGTLVPGPIDTCAEAYGGMPQYVLADFDSDGDQDMLLSDICTTSTANPVSAEVVFSDGHAPVVLESTSDLSVKYTVFAIDLNYDGIPDAGVITVSGGVTTTQYFLNDGFGNFTEQ